MNGAEIAYTAFIAITVPVGVLVLWLMPAIIPWPQRLRVAMLSTHLTVSACLWIAGAIHHMGMPSPIPFPEIGVIEIMPGALVGAFRLGRALERRALEKRKRTTVEGTSDGARGMSGSHGSTTKRVAGTT